MVAKPSDPVEFPEYHPWRRVLSFLVVFILCAAAGLSYVYTRPGEYRASLRLQISPARAMTGANQTADQSVSFGAEVKALTGRAVLQDSLTRLNRAELIPDLGRDPVGALQRMLRTRVVGRGHVVELAAEGAEPEFLERLLETVVEAYRDRTIRLYNEQSAREYQELKKEAKNLRVQAVAAHTDVDAFRDATEILSEEGENAVLANLQNLSRAYSTSVRTLAKAQLQLQALKKILSAGLELDPDLAALEQREIALREQLADLQRRYTPQYLALDPNTRSLPERLADLQRQIAAKRKADQAAPILAAEDELQRSQAQLEQLGSDLAAGQKKAEVSSNRLAEYAAMHEDVGRVDQIAQKAVDHLTDLQATQREEEPRVDILQPAVSGPLPVRPGSTRDAWIAIAASFWMGILAAWLAGLTVGSPAVGYWDSPVHMRSWDGSPKLTSNSGHPRNDRELIRLLPPPQSASSAQ